MKLQDLRKRQKGDVHALLGKPLEHSPVTFVTLDDSVLKFGLTVGIQHRRDHQRSSIGYDRQWGLRCDSQQIEDRLIDHHGKAVPVARERFYHSGPPMDVSTL